MIIDRITASEVLKQPWPHQIVDDFLDRDLFRSLQQNSVYLLDKYGLVKGDRIDPTNLIDLKKDIDPSLYYQIWEYNKLLLQNCEKIFKLYPEHRSYENYYSMPSFHFMHPNAGFHQIHDETKDKSLSIVLYIHPHDGVGTRIYTSSKEEDFYQEISWKPNRAMIFCGIENTTWHGFGTNNKPRVTLNFFLRKNILPKFQRNKDSVLIENLDGTTETMPLDEDFEEFLNLLEKKYLTT